MRFSFQQRRREEACRQGISEKLAQAIKEGIVKYFEQQ